jgi:hypothetical protein
MKKLFFKKEVDPIKIFTKYKTANQYSIIDEKGKKIYYAMEDKEGLLSKNVLGTHFSNTQIHLFNLQGNRLLTILKKARFLSKASGEIVDSNNSFLCTIGQKGFFSPFSFLVQDSNKNLILSTKQKGYGLEVFQEENKIADILKKWSPVEFLTETNKLTLELNENLDKKTEYLIISLALFFDIVIWAH